MQESRFTLLSLLLPLGLIGLLMGPGCAPRQQGQGGPGEQMDKEIPLPPGMARVAATMIACDEGEARYDCVLRVERVEEYGPSTPPLSEGAEVNIMLRKSILAERPSPVTAEGTRLTMKIQAMEVKGGAGPVWEVVEIY